MSDIIRIVVTGVAISSIWFWLFTILTRSCEHKVFKVWMKIIVPQGVLIAWALSLAGII